MIKLTHHEWKVIRVQIIAEHGQSMVLLRDKMKRELGFTVRDHKLWAKHPNGDTRVGFQICLDFYNDSAETMFRLRYL
jgi:hypothetical protein